MGRHIPRTAADELRDAQAALAKAQRALTDLRSHLAKIAANPGDAPAIARAADRNAGIVESEISQAASNLRAVGNVERVQLSSVS